LNPLPEHPFVSLENLERLYSIEPRFETIVSECGIPPAWKREPGFESLIRIVLEQQLSLASAKAHFERLRLMAGSLEPGRLLELSDEEYTRASISRQKRSYVRAMAEKALSGALDPVLRPDALEHYGSSQIDELLSSIKGVGPWTRSVYRITALGDPDLFPLGDVALNRSFEERFGPLADPTSQQRIESWSPLRSLAAYCLWQAYLHKRNRRIEY